MLPTAARDLLDLDAAEADALAARGDVATGHKVLLAGLRRAEASQAGDRA
jgi:hypothetical protein